VQRDAITTWWGQGKRFCPRSGTPLRGKVLNISPNNCLKEAIQRW
jgi:hypothetical protein